MTAVSKIEAPPRDRTQRHARRASIYPERGSPIRVAVERTERINAAIVETLRKTAKYPATLAHCLTQDSE